MPELSECVGVEPGATAATAQAPSEKLRSRIALGVKHLLQRSESRRCSSSDLTDETAMPLSSRLSSAQSLGDVTSNFSHLDSAYDQDAGYHTYLSAHDAYECDSLWMTTAGDSYMDTLPSTMSSRSTDTRRSRRQEDEKIRRLIGEMRRSRGPSPLQDVDRESGVIFVAGDVTLRVCIAQNTCSCCCCHLTRSFSFHFCNVTVRPC